jgi:hypothetical protein
MILERSKDRSLKRSCKGKEKRKKEKWRKN